MKNNDSIPLARQGRVKEFPGQQPAGIRQAQDHLKVFAPLSLVYRKGISEFEARLSLLTKVAVEEVVRKTKLRAKFDPQNPWRLGHLFRAELADHHPCLAIRDIQSCVLCRIHSLAVMIAHVDHFIAINNLFRAFRFRDFSEFFAPRKVHHVCSELSVNEAIHSQGPMREFAHWTQYLPMLGTWCTTG